MTTFNLTQCPTNVQVSLIANTALYPSPLIASAQTLDRQGYKWKLAYQFDNLIEEDRAILMGVIAAVRGQAHRLRVPVYDNPSRGGGGGTPVVAGASQVGNTLNLSGATATVTNWLMLGDYFSVVVNGDHELKMVTANASSDGGGLVTVTFEPRLRASPANGATVYVEPANVPRGVFVMENAVNGWTSRPHKDGIGISSFTLNMIEDVFATQ